MQILIFCLVIVFQKGWVDRIWQKLQPDVQGERAGFSGRSLFWGTDQTPRLLAAWRFLISFHTRWNGSEKRIWWFMLRPRLGSTSGSKVTCLPPAYFKHQEALSSKAPWVWISAPVKSPSCAERCLHPRFCRHTQTGNSLPTGSLGSFSTNPGLSEPQR